jgi:uncharacterized metal-binding protein
MEETKKCLCGCSDVRVVTCCGASNVGQIANQAAIMLSKELGIEKSHEIAFDKKDCSVVVEKVKEEMGCKPPESTSCLNRWDRSASLMPAC